MIMEILMILLTIVLMLIPIAFLVFWIWMIIDVVKRENFEGENDKVLWIIVVLLAGVIGAAVYYFLIKKKLD
ncbi:hypothetical protein HN681_03105 [archaeon]|jgi:hypothetical protein|nr:hypothetical protein [archaeon]MBT3730956.1 hypothetical protein [archaeon]MBT4669806.1 hypothetical protein [archaeon]MBT5029957.1 hypothetical protein [archaeon]MBT5288528.1 hypothetical protein [archaeon]